MRPDIEALARHRLSRAHETLTEGEQLLAQSKLMGAVNRFYYAAFYGARALLATRDADSSKHSGVISLFQKQFVKTGLFDVARARALSRSFEKRQKSDDGDFSTVAPEEARGIGEEVQVFVDECARVLERLIAQE